MTYPADNFLDAVDLAVIGSNQLHEIINGDASTEITVDDGSKIPSLRKAYSDAIFFKSPIPWQSGDTETNFLQLRSFLESNGYMTWWFAKGATNSTAITMGSTPYNDPNWTLYNFSANSIYQIYKRLASDAGFVLKGTFYTGAVISTVSDVILDEKSGLIYSWGGTLPITVVAGDTPETLGVSPTTWIDKTSITLRSYVDLQDSNLQDQIDTLSSGLLTTNNNLQITNNAIVALDSELQTAQNDISALQIGLQTANSDIDTLELNLATTNQNLTNLSNDTANSFTSVNNDIDTLETAVSGIQSTIGGFSADVALEALRRSYADAGYTLVSGSFENGGTLTNTNDVLLLIDTGIAYSWAGTLPKVVAAGTDPSSDINFVMCSDAGLRDDLAGVDGINMVGGSYARFASVASMTASSVLDGMIATTAGYYSSADGGGAQYVYSASSTALAEGFLCHAHAGGGRWLLVDNRSRLPMQVSGARVDGVTDDRTAFLAVLASKRRMSLSGEMLISGPAIDLSSYVTAQRLGIDIEGDDPSLSSISFTDGSGGLVASVFFRGLTLHNLTIKNASLDKTGVGFSNPNGAELLDWVNVTFTGWRCGHSTHCWNSSMRNVTSRGCYYAGAYRGTSYHGASFYAHTCDFGHCLGFAFNTSTNLIEVHASVGLSYTTISSFAADQCGVPYLIGRCYNLKVQSCGAEKSTGAYAIDATQAIPSSRQLVVIDTFDLYVQSTDGTTTIVNTAANMNNSLIVKDTRVYSDKSIPLCSGSGKGVMFDNVRYNSSGVKPMTTTTTDGVTISSPVIIGSDPASLSKVGFDFGGYSQLRQVKAIVPMVVSATSKIVIRLQDTSVAGLSAGICAFGKATFYPVHKSAGNAARDCGTAVFSVAADYAGGLTSINLQKLGTLATLTAANRQSGTVQELAFTLTAASVQYMCELEFWCNGKFASSFIDYYTE